MGYGNTSQWFYSLQNSVVRMESGHGWQVFRGIDRVHERHLSAAGGSSVRNEQHRQGSGDRSGLIQSINLV